VANHPKFQTFTGSNGKLYFRLTAKNGQPILASQGYADISGAKKGIESVRKNAADDERYDRKTAANGQFFFNLTATNGQTIGTSEMYTSSSAREKGIESVKTNAPGAEVETE
jgi:uncharacterized protein YegP (UPF0339 family)